MSKSTIVISASTAFFRHATEISDELERLGYAVLLPENARRTKEQSNFTEPKEWSNDPSAYGKKAHYMRVHFDKISKSDAMLVINDEKHGVVGYIGPNVLLEMSLAWYQKKPIYLLNQFPDDSLFEEELKAMAPIILDGNLQNILA